MPRPVTQTDSDADDQLPFVWPPAGPEPRPGVFIEPKPGAPGRPRQAREQPERLSPKSRWFEELETALLGTRARVLTGRDGRWRPEPAEPACPRCGRGVGEGEVSPDDGRCIGCRPERLGWERLVRLGAFGGPLREAILATKYEGWRRQGTVLGELLGSHLREELGLAGIEPGGVILVPVPMPAMRRLSRGIDHSLVLTRGVSRASGLRLETVLVRKWGKPQVRVAPSLRAGNVQRLIRAGFTPKHRPDLVVLIDDVKTTGATLRACCQAIRGTPWGRNIPIWSAVVAVTREPGRAGRVAKEPENNAPA